MTERMSLAGWSILSAIATPDLDQSASRKVQDHWYLFLYWYLFFALYGLRMLFTPHERKEDGILWRLLYQISLLQCCYWCIQGGVLNEADNNHLTILMMHHLPSLKHHRQQGNGLIYGTETNRGRFFSTSHHPEFISVLVTFFVTVREASTLRTEQQKFTLSTHMNGYHLLLQWKNH